MLSLQQPPLNLDPPAPIIDSNNLMEIVMAAEQATGAAADSLPGTGRRGHFNRAGEGLGFQSERESV
jgi:hypothetical protein